MTHSEQLLQSRAKLIEGLPPLPTRKEAEEGGCGVTGFACTIPVRGRHIFEPSVWCISPTTGKNLADFTGRSSWSTKKNYASDF